MEVVLSLGSKQGVSKQSEKERGVDGREKI